MTNTLHINIQALKPDFVQDLEEKYGPAADLEIRVMPGRQPGLLSEEQFWQIIDVLDWEQAGDYEAVIAPAVAHLAAMPVSYIYQFQDKLSEKLYALDTREHAQNTGSGSWTPDGPFSVDEFLYARCCVVANGHQTYEEALHDPAQMPENMDFEGLLYLASDAYQLKTGKEWAYVPVVSYETFSNERGWK